VLSTHIAGSPKRHIRTGRLGICFLVALLSASNSLADAADESGTAALAAPSEGQPPLIPLPPQLDGVPWPTEIWPEAEPNVDAEALASGVDALFTWIGRGGVPDTRALLIVQHGRIVFERYAEGFSRNSRFQTWSMAKSFTQSLVGILVRQGALDLDERAPVPEWQSEDDPRGKITLRQMLNMTSGIDNGDFSGGNPSTGGFAGQLLFGEGARDLNTYGANRPLVHPPGTHWAYSTATSTLIAGIVGRSVGTNATERRNFIHAELLDPIGAKQTTFEFDRTGQFLGGSHVYATARDFARFGLLYLRDGVWAERRILPEGWVDFARTRAPAENNGTYGGHFWINLKPKQKQFVLLPGGPSSVFEASGNAGQYVIVVPTHDLLIVRLGEMQSTDWNKLNAALAVLLEAFPASPIPVVPPSSAVPPGSPGSSKLADREDANELEELNGRRR
jgi:CubicO group peptidase (beta-lactamase class C family)